MAGRHVAETATRPGPFAAHLEGETLLAPTLLDFELTNLALKKARRRQAQASKVLVSLHAARLTPGVVYDEPAPPCH